MHALFGEQLRQRRRSSGASQLNLSLEAGVSTRHLSFLETGRARPSHAMVLRLSEALALPLRDRNSLLLAAGFAPHYREHGLDDEALAEARRALTFILEMHEPYPAFVLDRLWNLVLWNRTHETLIELISGGELDAGQLNGLDLVLAPGLLRPHILNWPVVAQAVLARLRNQIAQAPGDQDLAALEERVRGHPGVREVEDTKTEPVGSILIPLELRVGDLTLSLFSTLAVFGAAREVTLSELAS